MTELDLIARMSPQKSDCSWQLIVGSESFCNTTYRGSPLQVHLTLKEDSIRFGHIQGNPNSTSIDMDMASVNYEPTE